MPDAGRPNARDIVINETGKSYDSQPSAALLPDGTAWIAWRAYYRGEERILARSVTDDGPGREIVVAEPGVHEGPHILPTGPESVRIFWSSWTGKRWQVLGRRMVSGKWEEPLLLSEKTTDALHPRACALADGEIGLAFCALRDGVFEVRLRVHSQDRWDDVRTISDPQVPSFRPTVVRDPKHGSWAFWDAYVDGNYGVFGRRVAPKLGPIERVSPTGENCLTPVALASKRHGLCVAWLKSTDVIGGKGAIDQWHTLHMATRGDGGWTLIKDSEGSADAATLTHGLLARMKPKPGGIWGYLGRRRHPMLLDADESVWLLWERKSKHTGGTPSTTGQLIGRSFGGERWQTPVVLHEGLVDYHLPEGAKVDHGRFAFVASQLPREHRRIYHYATADLKETGQFAQGRWTGWKPVTLPLESEVPRHTIEIDGQRYRLYWADTHAHSGLSADVEGEPDEFLHYARDRARLDLVVMQENDEIYNCPLTESEYRLGCFFSNAFAREGEFLALPGYEWTQRYPKKAGADPAEYIGWPWKGTFPNHRTVIYPPPGGPIVRWTECGNEVAKLYEAIESAGGIMHTQHPSWVLERSPSEVAIEVTTGWGIYIANPKEEHAALNAGHRLAFVGTSDSHRRNPGLGGGLTGIYAQALTPAAIFEAYRAGRVFATNGSHIILDARLNGRPMGEVVEAKGDDGAELTLLVRAPKPVVKVSLIRDGKEIRTFEGDGRRELRLSHRDEGLSAGTHWYYWRVAQEGSSPQYPSNVKVARGHLAWSSPVWIDVGE